MKVRSYQVAHELKRLGARRCPWSVEWRENGQRRTKTIGAKADAEKFATIKRAELIDGAMGIVTRKRWADFVEEYVTLKVAHFRSAESRTLAVAILKTFTTLVKPQWVSGIDTKALDRFVTKRLAMTSRKTGAAISPETVKKELRTIRAALNVAREWKYLRDVPKMPTPKGYATDKRFVTEEDFDRIMGACDQARLPDPRMHHGIDPAEWWQALLATAWVTGLRIGALLALRWEDVDLARGVVWSRARDNKAKRDTRHHLGAAAELLRTMAHETPHVFPWYHHERTLWVEFARLQKAAEINLACLVAPGSPEHRCTDACHLYGFHDLRRAHATYNYGKVTDRALQQQMGHASFQTTQGYIRYAELHQADAYDAHLPLSLQDGEDGAKQRRNAGEESGERRFRVVAG